MRKLISTLIIVTMASALFAGDLVGTVTYEGKPPKRKTLRMDSDPVCGAAHKEAVRAESFIVDTSGNLANVIVYLKNVSPESPPSEAAVLDLSLIHI